MTVPCPCTLSERNLFSATKFLLNHISWRQLGNRENGQKNSWKQVNQNNFSGKVPIEIISTANIELCCARMHSSEAMDGKWESGRGGQRELVWRVCTAFGGSMGNEKLFIPQGKTSGMNNNNASFAFALEKEKWNQIFTQQHKLNKIHTYCAHILKLTKEETPVELSFPFSSKTIH